MKCLPPLIAIPKDRRSGTTLSEILVAMLVMSIGVLSVATLFPISILRTVQATQLTQGTQLRYNFEGLLGPRPDLRDGTVKWARSDSFYSSYVPGDLVLPTTGNFYLECLQGGASGVLEPAWRDIGQNTVDGDASWRTHRLRTYMVDPLGWEERGEEMSILSVAPALNTADLRNTFGRANLSANTVLPMDVTPGGFYRIVRFRGGLLPSSAPRVLPSRSNLPLASLGLQQDARRVTTLPDSWLQQADTYDLLYDNSDTTTRSRIDLTNSKTELVQTLNQRGDIAVVDFNDGAEEGGVLARAVIFDTSGKRSETRILQGIARLTATTERLAFDIPLPLGFEPARVRVETFDQRYSWMLACRRIASGATYMNLVVFFRRAFLPEDELIHRCHFVSNFPGPDGNRGTADDIPNDQVIIEYNGDLGADQKPALKRGGYICDAENNRWYRIVSYHENTDPLSPALVRGLSPLAAATALDPTFPGDNSNLSDSATTRCALVKLESPILENSGIYRNVPAANRNPAPGAIVMQGIIDVYQLDPSLPWE